MLVRVCVLGRGVLLFALEPSKDRRRYQLSERRATAATGSVLFLLLDREQGRWFYWLPVFIGLGIGIYFALPHEPVLKSLLPLIISLIAAIKFAARSLSAVLLLGVVLATATGFVSAKLRTEWVRAPKIIETTGPVRIEGWVERIEIRAAGKTGSKPGHPRLRISLRLARAEKIAADRLPIRVRLSGRFDKDQIRIGDYISALAVLRPPPAPSEPGGYDFARAAWYKQLGAVGYLKEPPKTISPDETKSLGLGLRVAIETLREDVARRINSVLGGSTGAIATALLTGARGGIPEGVKIDLRHSGLAHILAISGLHMVIMSGAVFWLVRALLAGSTTLALTQPIKKWSAVIAMIGAFFYLALSGASPATQRAFLMVMLFYLAILLDRPALTLRNVAIAAIVILLFWPESLLNISFQMSFAAVTALIAFYEVWNERQRQRQMERQWMSETWRTRQLKNGLDFLIAIGLTTIIAGAAIAPFAAFHFNKEAGYSLIGNMLVMPIFTLITMPMALLSLMAMPFGLEALPLKLMGMSIERITAIAAWVADLPGAVLYIPQVPAYALLSIIWGALWLIIWRQGWRYLGLIGIAAGLALSQSGARPDILIGDHARTIAVRNGETQDGYARLSAPRGSARSYVLARWLENDGDPRKPKESAKGKTFKCDAQGCMTVVKNLAIAHSRHPSGLADDCAVADILIARYQVKRPCSGPKLILDRRATERSGVHAIYIDGASIRVETVEASRGARPWTQQRRE